MKYFAYGSNMLPQRLQRRIPGARMISSPCVLEGYKLVFHKEGRDGSAKCDIIQTGLPIDCVQGVLFEINNEELIVLDRYEGRGYRRDQVSVTGPDGHSVSAITYFATRINHSLLPFDWYFQHVLEGAIAANLDPAYIAEIKEVACKQDPDSARADMERSIYQS